jgi:hypothetical protein
MSDTTLLPLADIVFDRALQPCVDLNYAIVRQYAEHMRNGAESSTITVYLVDRCAEFGL